MGVKLTLFGTFALEVEGRLRELPTRKCEALLAYLALRPDSHHRRESLASLLWADVSAAQARHSLRQALWRTRQAFEDQPQPILVAEGDMIHLHRNAIDIDARTFERLASSSESADLERAAELYRGDLLPGFELEETRLDNWLAHERNRLHNVAVDVLARLLRGWETADGERVIRTASSLLSLDATQEHVHRVLMKTYWRLGRPADALRQYNYCARVLQQELGVEPDAETRRLCQEILVERARGSAPRPQPAQPPPVTTRGTPTVLVLESDPLTRTAIERALCHAGYATILRPATGDPTLFTGQFRAVVCGLSAAGSRLRMLSRLRSQGYRGFVLFVSEEVPWSHATAAGGLRVGYTRRPVRARSLLAALREGLADLPERE